GLRGVVVAGADAHPGFLEHFAADRILERLAGLDETGQCREAFRRQARHAAEQTGVAPGDDDDDGRVGAREMLHAALWIRTLCPMAGRLEPDWRRAVRAVARACLPVGQAQGI